MILPYETSAQLAVACGECKTEQEYEDKENERLHRDIERYRAAKERGELLDPSFNPVRELLMLSKKNFMERLY